MTDPTPAVAPLDAYPTAKPDEPTFTLQGGDPLAAPLVGLWARLARALCGMDIEPSATMLNLDRIIAQYQISDNEREIDDLLTRATAAEQVMWSMEAYLKSGGSDAEAEAKPAGENSLDTAARLDLHDWRVRYASTVSGMAGTLNDMRLDLLQRGFLVAEDENDNIMQATSLVLQQIFKALEPRRLFHAS